MVGSFVFLHESFSHYVSIAKQMCKLCNVKVRPRLSRSLSLFLSTLSPLSLALVCSSLLCASGSQVLAPRGNGCQRTMCRRHTLAQLQERGGLGQLTAPSG